MFDCVIFGVTDQVIKVSALKKYLFFMENTMEQKLS